mgnify:CR=1 FL=1
MCAGMGSSDAPNQPNSTPEIVHHDWQGSEPPTVAVVKAVAAATDRTPTGLPLLQNTLNPDALNALLTRGAASVTISFQYAGVIVSASGDGIIKIRIDKDPIERDSM